MGASFLALSLAGCAAGYKAQPVPFRLPSSYPNVITLADASVAAKAYADNGETKQTFGFDVRAAGLLPVEVVFDNQGSQSLTINPQQTFLEDEQGNLWPVLADRFAYERVTKYAQTKKIFREGAYAGFFGTAAGTLVGAAVGVVTEEDVATAAAKGAAVGAAAGALLGSASGYQSAEEAKQQLLDDFEAKSLRNRPVNPGNLAYGFIFFPGEAKTPRTLRLQLRGRDQTYTVLFAL
jgi:hypothetical protein